jgi:hypothetical protein
MYQHPILIGGGQTRKPRRDRVRPAGTADANAHPGIGKCAGASPINVTFWQRDNTATEIINRQQRGNAPVQ